jgi:hypothetical protein
MSVEIIFPTWGEYGEDLDERVALTAFSIPKYIVSMNL